MKAAPRIGPTDPRDPRKTLLAIVLTLLVLGWFIYVLVTWPRGVLFVDP